MKSIIPYLLICSLFTAFLPPLAGALESPEPRERSGSPYFFVKSEDPETDRLPLKSTRVDASIAGVIADVKVTQVYANEGENPLEAIYVFPASTRAAVYGMKMTIGERTIVAEIKERKAARETYEQAKEEGRSASLLEQERPNVFQMNVANIMPGDEIEVELSYTEVLVPEEKIYSFVYPTVVGPRYTGPQGSMQPAAEDWTENPYLHEGEAPTSRIDIHVSLQAGMPIGKIACSTHETDIRYDGKDAASVSLADSGRYGGNRDFIVKYRLAGGSIKSGLMLYEGKDANYFLLMMQPPERVVPEEVPPREYIFIVDVSGSMNGFPLDTSKALLKDLIGRLRPTDRFNVLLFAGASRLLSEHSLSANQENIARAVHFIGSQRGGGGTQLLPALERALQLPASEAFSRTLVVATDGFVSAEKESFDLIRENLGKSNLFSFGIGSSVNRYLIEGMARAGAGEPFVVTKPAAAARTAERFRQMIETPLLTGMEIDFGGFDVYDVEPPSIPDMFAERPVVVFGKYEGKPSGNVRLSGRTGKGVHEQRLDVSEVRPDSANTALRYLWARNRIAVLSDYNKVSPDGERKEQITRLGLEYSLLTDYTSFVAVDTRVRSVNGRKVTTVKQPLPLPQGVSDLAVGGAAPRALAVRKMARSMLEQSIAREQVETAPEPEKADGASKQAPKVQARIEKITGSVDRKAVEEKLARLEKALSKCFGNGKAGLPADPLRLTLEVDGRGRLVNVTHEPGSGAPGAALAQCLRESLEKFTYSKSTGGVGYTVVLVIE